MGRSLGPAGQPAQPPCQAPGQGETLFKKQGGQNLRNSTRAGRLASTCLWLHIHMLLYTCVCTHTRQDL